MKKELELVLIPTKSTENSLIKNKSSNNSKGLFWKYKNTAFFTRSYLNSVPAETFHLYLLNKEELKVKDYVLLDNSQHDLFNYQKQHIIELSDETLLESAVVLNCSKVVATTDKSLTCSFPTFSEDFINVFIEEYNNHNNLVNTVMVEFTKEYVNNYDCSKVDITDGCSNPKHCVIKETLALENNNIKASLIVDLYDKDRVRAIVYKALNEAIDWHGQGGINYELLIENWIKQNI